MFFFVAGNSFEQLVFRNTFFGSRYFLRRVNFSEKLVLRNQLHCIYTRKEFPLTIIYSFEYSMGWSDFETPQFFIVENSKQCMNFNTECVTNVAF